MTTYNLSAFAGAGAQFFDDNGVPLVGGKLYSYASGTTTPLATYTSSTGTVANTNPIILNAGGRTANEIWQPTGVLYKFVLYTSTDELIGTYDGIPSINDPFGINSQLGSVAGTNTITATATPTLTAYVTGAIYSFIAANTNTGAVTLSIDGLTAKSVTKNGSVTLSAGDIQIGKMMLVEYDGAVFQLINNIVYGGSITNGNIVSLTAPMAVSNGGTGLATLTANNVMLGNGAASVNFVAPGTSGNVLTSDGTTWASTTPVLSGFYNMQVFTATGTFTVPTGITKVKVTVVGGGGGGASASSGGGGGGGAAIKIITGLTPAGTVAVTVGAGGAVQTTGGTSSFGAHCSATGGAGGTSGTNGAGAGGIGSSGLLNIGGTAGGPGCAGGIGLQGSGGSSILGGGGVSAAAGQVYGGGGGCTSTGAAGVVIVEY